MYVLKISATCLFPFIFTDNYWGNVHNRRKFFVEFALQKGFDPLLPENWNNVKTKDILEQVKNNELKGGEEITNMNFKQ